jgi:hypothetical protein
MESSVTESARRAPGNRATILGAAAAVWALVAACAAPQPVGPLLLHPLPPSLEGYSLSQGVIVFSGPDFNVSVRPRDYRLVAEEFRRAGEPGPFGDSEQAVGKFLFLSVRLENRSTRTLVFNPMRSALLREAEAPLLPLENSDLFAFAGDEIVVAEARSRAFRRVSFDITATVRPGQELERYLTFHAPEEADKPLMLAIEDLWLGGTSFDLRFPFEAYPGK